MTRRVVLLRSVVSSLLTYSKQVHPREGILLLRGRVKREMIRVEEVIIPPFAVHGESFSQFSPWALPLDLSIVGVAHSHPSGVLRTSVQDLIHYYGLITVIVAYPYQSEKDIGVFDREGRRIGFEVI